MQQLLTAGSVCEPHAGMQVVVFSKTYCPYCIKAKNALKTLVQPDQMEIIEVGSWRQQQQHSCKSAATQ
jgi:glutaredoxin